MTTTTLTLADFLLARIDEDEDAAQDCGVNEWVATFTAGVAVVELAPGSPYPTVVVAEVKPRRWHAEGVVRGYHAHIARWDPARVLVECEAKRLLLRWHGGEHICEDGLAGERVDAYGDLIPACDVLKALALPYADHPDYRDEWRP